MPVPESEDVLVACFMHFFHMDKANAAVHLADVRFSPITFRLQEVLYPDPQPGGVRERGAVWDALYEVYAHNGSYEKDPGR